MSNCRHLSVDWYGDMSNMYGSCSHCDEEICLGEGIGCLESEIDRLKKENKELKAENKKLKKEG